MSPDFLVHLAILLPIFVASIALHELAHALVADAMGDPTPREQGRLTLNPAAHLDFFGTLMIVFAGFGWAKPVQVKPYLFRWPRLGSFLVSLAGPTTNLVLAALALVALRVHYPIPMGSRMWLEVALDLNIVLAVLNFLPLPPLDGGNLLESLLPRRWLPAYEHLVPYGMVLLVLAVVNPWFKPLDWLFGLAIGYAHSLL